MDGRRGFQGNKEKRGKTYPTPECFMFVEHGVQLYKYCNEEGFISLDQALLLCEKIEPYISRSSLLVCSGDMKT